MMHGQRFITLVPCREMHGFRVEFIHVSSEMPMFCISTCECLFNSIPTFLYLAKSTKTFRHRKYVCKQETTFEVDDEIFHILEWCWTNGQALKILPCCDVIGSTHIPVFNKIAFAKNRCSDLYELISRTSTLSMASTVLSCTISLGELSKSLLLAWIFRSKCNDCKAPSEVVQSPCLGFPQNPARLQLVVWFREVNPDTDKKMLLPSFIVHAWTMHQRLRVVKRSCPPWRLHCTLPTFYTADVSGTRGWMQWTRWTS